MPRIAILWAAVAAIVLPPLATAQEYLKKNTAVGYEVDAAWPRRPESLAPWGHVPGIAVDAQDNVWVFNRGEDPVQVFTAEGEFLRTWGRGVIGNAHHIKIDHEGNVWLSDIVHHVVQKYSPGGELLLTLGTPGEAGDDDRHFNKPTDMAISLEGDIFVADGYGNNRVVHFDRYGQFVKSWGTLGIAPGEFNLPHAICIDSKGRLYVADRNNARVQVFDREGKFLDQWTNLVVPWGFCITADDEIWVCGSSPMQWWKPEQHTLPLGCPPKDQVLMRFNTSGKLLQLWSVPKAVNGQERPGELNWVHGMAVDSQGNLYLGDILGMRAQKFVRIAADE